MNTAIIAAIILALGTVIGALINALFKNPEKRRLKAAILEVGDSEETLIEGCPLSSLPCYPVDLVEHQILLSPVGFMECVSHLLEEWNPLAAAELVYLGEHNKVDLNHAELRRYKKLKNRYGLTPTFQAKLAAQRNGILDTYRDIVDGFGRTFSGAGIEIVLHDVRDPLGSVILIENPITGRREGSSITDFGLDMIKSHGRQQWRGNKIGYRVKLNDGRLLKSSTIPLRHPRFGLVGFICINIDITELQAGSSEALSGFVESFVHIPLDSELEEIFPKQISAGLDP